MSEQDIIRELGAAVSAAELTKAQISEERDRMNQLLGQIQMADTLKKMTHVVSLTKLAYIKEHKLYQALKGQKFSDGEGSEIPNAGTWDGFCRAIGSSRQKIDEDLQNLRLFGEEALDAMKQMGIGYREMRQYRRLPEDKKTALTMAAEEAAKTGDRDAFVDLAEELISKHVKERESLEKSVETLQADLTAREEVLKEKNERLDRVQEELLRIKNLPQDQRLAFRIEREDTALKDLWAAGQEFIGYFNKYLGLAGALLNRQELSHHASETVMNLTSAMCARFDEELRNAGIDIDFRQYVYPVDCPQRGTAELAARQKE